MDPEAAIDSGMLRAAFVAPFGLEATLRFAEAAASLPGVALGWIGQEGPERLPPGLRSRLAGHESCDVFDAEALTRAVRRLETRMGGVERLLGVLEPLQEPLADARRRLGLQGLGPEAAHAFRDKSRMKDLWRAAGVPCAHHELLRSVDDGHAFARRTGYPLVLKPPAGMAAKATVRVDDSEALEQALRWLEPSAAAPVLAEEHLQGREGSFDAVFVQGRCVWHSVSRYSPTPLEVLRNPWIQWTVLLPREVLDPADPLRQAAERALGVLGLETGLSHLEWFVREDGRVAVSEAAARPPGARFVDLISWAHEVDFHRVWAELALFDRFEQPTRRWAVGAAYLRAQGAGGSITRVRGLEEAQRAVGSLVVDVRLPRPGQIASGTYEGDGQVILRHPETAVVEEALRRVVELVKVE